MARKLRHNGTPSTSEPPVDAPDWTVDPEWRNDPGVFQCKCSKQWIITKGTSYLLASKIGLYIARV